MEVLQNLSWTNVLVVVLGLLMTFLLAWASKVGLKIKELVEQSNNKLAVIGIQAVAVVINEVVDFYAVKYKESELMTFLDEIVDTILEKAGLAGIHISKETAQRLAMERIAVKEAGHV